VESSVLMLEMFFFCVSTDHPYIKDIKTDKIVIMKGENVTLSYIGEMNGGEKFNPRDLFLHFDGTKVIGSMAHFWSKHLNGHSEGWGACINWNLDVASGIYLL